MHCVIIIILYRWYLAEFDIDTFEMSDDKLKAYKQEISELGDDKSHRWPVEFSGGRRKEIEVCQLEGLFNYGLNSLAMLYIDYNNKQLYTINYTIKLFSCGAEKFFQKGIQAAIQQPGSISILKPLEKYECPSLKQNQRQFGKLMSS